jgi:hypothetical protein
MEPNLGYKLAKVHVILGDWGVKTLKGKLAAHLKKEGVVWE